MPKGKGSRKKRPDHSITQVDSSQNDDFPKIRTIQMKKFQALDLLKGSNHPSQIRYRDQQIIQIKKYIDLFLNGNTKKGGKYRILIITGSPGVGKTLCTNHILRKSAYKVINLNANLVKSLTQVQSILSQALLPDKPEKQLSTFQLLCELEEHPPQPCILYIEEIQLLLKCVPDLFTSDFFSLFSQKKIKLMLIGISNTVDTLQKYGQRLQIKVPEITNIVFQPYTIFHIKSIMEAKFTEVSQKSDISLVMSDKLLLYSANKLQAMKKGDLRVVFQFLKQIGNIVLSKKFNPQSNEQIVTIQIVNEAFNKIKSSKEKLLTQIPFQQQIILVAFYDRLKMRDQISISVRDLKTEVKRVYEEMKIDHKKDIDQELSELQTYGFICLKKSKSNKNHEQYLLKISLSQIEISFKSHPLLGMFIHEEQFD